MAETPNPFPGEPSGDPFDTPSNRRAFQPSDPYGDPYPTSFNWETFGIVAVSLVAAILALALLVRIF